MYAVRYLDRYDDLLAVHAAHPARYPYLLESAARGTPQARFDVLPAFPQQQLTLQSDGRLTGEAGTETAFLEALDAWYRRERVPGGEDPDVPFRGGWFLYLGYELAGVLESRLRLPAAPPAWPTALAVRVPAAILRDHQRQRLALVAEAGHEALLEALQRDLEQAPAVRPPPGDLLHHALEEDPAEAYCAAVEQIRRYVIDGDVFQVNLSRGWRGHLVAEVTPAQVYDRLRRTNPGPFSGLALNGQAALISSSPERLVRVRGGKIDTRPIAGTRPRGQGAEQDAGLSRELMAHPKERAEHVMLIDLERNDLGRVCTPGSVRVSELMALESYAHVHHIVSNVEGRLRADVTPGDVIRAVFPGGTITGCPKVRCMEIIAELEGEGRGAYTGSMGYLNRDGDMDLNILIRTMVTDGRTLTLRAGAGIVADSEPERELDETRAKAAGVVRALQGSGGDGR